MLTIGAVIQDALDDPEIDGVVVVQGTDTIEETASPGTSCCDRSKPVVVTGAMRASHEAGYDGPANLRGPSLRPRPALGTSASSLASPGPSRRPMTPRRCTRTAFDTFRSPNCGSLGRVGEDGVVVLDRPRGTRRSPAPAPTDGARVELVHAGIGSDGAMLDAAVATARRASCGSHRGRATPRRGCSPQPSGRSRTASRRPASRCPAGAVSTAYAFPGGGATWVRAGAIPTGTLCAIKARVALALGLGAGSRGRTWRRCSADPIG